MTSAGTAEPLEDSKNIVHKLELKAESGLTGNIYIGDSNVSSANGYPLGSGEMVELEFVDLNEVYVDADSNGQSVKFLYVK